MKKHIITIELKKLDYHDIITACEHFYRETGCKFSIEFQGSKGYLNSVNFHIEGHGSYSIKPNIEKVFFFKTDSNEFYAEVSK